MTPAEPNPTRAATLNTLNSARQMRGDGALVGDSMTKTNGQLAGLQRSRIAVAAYCSERTVKRYLDGVSVSQSTRERIEGALRKLGLAGAVRAGVA